MKNYKKLTVAFLLFGAILSGCKDKSFQTNTYQANVPVYITQESYNAMIKVEGSKLITETGKIYLKDNYLFINKPNEGIHIFDNTDPSAPQNIAFVAIPGNTDLVVKGNTLYANSRMDLVALDISNINNPIEVGRVVRAFPNVLPDPGNSLPLKWDESNPGVIIGWVQDEVTEVTETTNSNYRYEDCFDCKYDQAVTFENSVSGGVGNDGNSSAGVGGSMASMTIVDNHIIAISHGEIISFGIVNAAQPIETSREQQWRELETLFAYRNNLFIGTTTGMLIYNISNPGSPSYVSVYNHFRSCDPVVVENDIAYVTLRSNNLCGGSNNQLDIIDISDINNPTDIASYDMVDPHGLGIDNGTLFLCDGNAGLKVYEVSTVDSVKLNHLTTHANINAFDVIPLNDKLFMIGSDGLYQYSYSTPESLQLLSVIATN